MVQKMKTIIIYDNKEGKKKERTRKIFSLWRAQGKKFMKQTKEGIRAGIETENLYLFHHLRIEGWQK